MDYFVLQFLHIIGVIALGSGLVGAFVADPRARQSQSLYLIAEAYRYKTIFYGALVFPGAILVGASGLLLVYRLNLGFFEQPWLTGMWMLFLFEFVEGNSITRLYFRRVRIARKEASSTGAVTQRLHSEVHTAWGTFTHYLDIPLFAVMVSLGAMRPSTWGYFFIGAGIAITAATALTIIMLRAYRR